MLSRNRARKVKQLLRRKGRASSGLFLVEGVQAVREALTWSVPSSVSSGISPSESRSQPAVVARRVDTHHRRADADPIPVTEGVASDRCLDQAMTCASDDSASGATHLPSCLVELVIVDDPSRHPEIIELASGHTVVTATSDDLNDLTDTVTPQGVFAVCRQLPWQLSDLIDPSLVVICSQIRDPGNAGTVIRCADAFGADAVILTTDSVELYNPKTIRASVGSLFHLPVITGISVEDAVNYCREQGMSILAADASGIALTDLAAGADLNRPTAWMMGNEAWGLPEDVRALVDHTVAIPMWGRAESLNLSTAAAICLYTSAVSQRTRRDPGQGSPNF